MKPFLYSIAEAYILNEGADLQDYCFVFPNKRSGVFFHHAFARASRELGISVVHPASTTISSFIEDMVPGKPAERLEMILILYQAYREVIFRHAGGSREAQEIAEMVDFNKFQRWSDMIIGDFNDVDMYLVDAAQLFPNLEHYREISANYLEPEVIEEIKRHWRVERIPEYNDSFWNHILHAGTPDDEGSRQDEDSRGSALRFFRLWQVMLELYETFRRKMAEAGLFYPGMAYREATRIIKERDRSDFDHKRYIFVGFNMLSRAEESIFKEMKEKRGEDLFTGPFADFYFDDASPAFLMPGNTTAAFLDHYTRLFPSLYDCVERITGFPRIEISGIASKAAQAKLAGAIVGHLYPKSGEWNPELLRRTAIILPQETMARGIVAALPEWVTPVNLTMGYRLRDSKAAGLVRDIVSMHLRSRKSRDAGHTFFYEDVLKVLTHPLIRQTYPAECSRIVYDINVNRWYNIDGAYLTEHYPGLSTLFKYVEDSGSREEVFSYFENLFNWLLSHMADDTKTEAVTGIDGTEVECAESMNAGALVDRMLARAYLRAIGRLRDLSSRYLTQRDIFLADSTLFHLIERLVGGETVNFEGRPLNGLQVMGVLEARGLDFENVIIPSMNEKVFPRKHYQKSFIPPHLRRAYGMATQDHQESIYSYYFYRMISRASRVFLLYDARTQGVGGGQMSRYLGQLLHLYKPAGISSRILGYGVESRDTPQLSVRKTPEIMAELKRYLTVENPRPLSASSINQYINCPLSFYLTCIAGYKREDEFHDYMDESTYGTIIHGVLEDLYGAERHTLPEGRFTRQAIEALMKKEVSIEQAITRRINRHYNRLGDNCLTPLKGDAEIFGEIMKKYILLVLRREIEAGEFEYIAGEFGAPGRLRLQGSTSSIEINYTYSIDRIDRISTKDGDSVLRIIDYKTGEDETSIIDIRDMFQDRGKSGKRAKAMLQLFLYCQALAQAKNLDEPIQPWIYSIRKVATTPFSPLRISSPSADDKRGRKKTEITDYRDYVIEFNDMMLEVLDDLFNPEIPFTAAQNDHACTFCKFTEICRRRQK
ncbi:MAG: PD-(D/E)XK nuclease family protein [Muribaculaceae bacterium]|nr:PD-(D/E)XK nuclease family protein [Muribaculaceae bacterium]